MQVKHSVSTRIAKYLFFILTVAGIISFLSLAIMASNRFDAEAINMSGSLRVQSYRILYDMEKQPDAVQQDVAQYQHTLNASTLQQIQQQIFVPKAIGASYQKILDRWATMSEYALAYNSQAYNNELVSYVKDVDRFVYELQLFAEQKWVVEILVLSFSMTLIVLVISYVIWYTRKEVVKPLEQMTQASMQVQMGQFNHIPLNTQKDNELGVLARTFTEMSSQLGKLYSRLEDAVNEKTQKLRQTNRALTTLYQSSQYLSADKINDKVLSRVLDYIRVSEHLRYIQLEIFGAEHWEMSFGNKQPHQHTQIENLVVENEHLAVLSWQAGLPCPDPRMIQNIGQMIARALYFHKNQRQQEQLLLMEERSIIARELHDSLAQTLSFLQIQLTLLKHNLKKEDKSAKEKSLAIIGEFEQALSDGYVQLRELLTTFRLTIQEADLQLAIEQVLESLRNQTDMQMSASCNLPAQSLNPQQLIHVLQIVREAVLNAIKHSQGSILEVLAHTNKEGEYEILVRDNGIGIPSLKEPEGHYGLNIMHERSTQLNAELIIANRPTGGTEIKIVLPPQLF